jgi:hypothetical protein
MATIFSTSSAQTTKPADLPLRKWIWSSASAVTIFLLVPDPFSCGQDADDYAADGAHEGADEGDQEFSHASSTGFIVRHRFKSGHYVYPVAQIDIAHIQAPADPEAFRPLALGAQLSIVLSGKSRNSATSAIGSAGAAIKSDMRLARSA